MSCVCVLVLFPVQFMLVMQGHLEILLEKSLGVGSVVLLPWTAKHFSFQPWEPFHFGLVLPCIFKLAGILDMNRLFHRLRKESLCSAFMSVFLTDDVSL